MTSAGEQALQGERPDVDLLRGGHPRTVSPEPLPHAARQAAAAAPGSAAPMISRTTATPAMPVRESGATSASVTSLMATTGSCVAAARRG